MSEPTIGLNLLQSRTILVVSFPSQCLVWSMSIFNKTCVEGELQRKIRTRCIHKKYTWRWCKYGSKVALSLCSDGDSQCPSRTTEAEVCQGFFGFGMEDDMFQSYIITWNGSRFQEGSGKASVFPHRTPFLFIFCKRKLTKMN